MTQRNASGQQRLYGVFAQELYDWSTALGGSMALRYDRWENRAGTRFERAWDGTGTATAFPDRSSGALSPKVGLWGLPMDGVALRAAAYTSFRAPTLEELYRPFQVGTVRTNANENLGPETLQGGEAGVDVGTRGGPMARVTGFWNELVNPIVNVTTGPSTKQRQNLGRARIRGLEADATLPVWGHLSLAAAYTFAPTRVTQAPGQTQLVGKQLPQAPAHVATGTLSFDDPSSVTAAVQLRYLGKQFEDDVNTLPMGQVALVDLFICWHASSLLDVYGAVENLFDEVYLVGRAGVDTVGQPRFLHGGVRLRWE